MANKKIFVLFSWHVEGFKNFGDKIQFDEENIELIKNVFVEEKIIKHSLLLEADEAVKAACGTYDYIFKNWHDLWKEKEELGHEIGWHFHTYIKDEYQWRQSFLFNEYKSSLFNSYDAIKDYFPINSVSSGWCYCDNDLIRTFDEIGIKVDASCLSGLKSGGFIPSRYDKIGIVNVHDWTGSPVYPYYVSKKDYRLESNQLDGKISSLNILEVPVTVDNRILFSLNENPFWFENVLNEIFNKSLQDEKTYFVHGYSHSYNMKENGLSNYQKNVEYLFKLSKKYNVDLEFVTLNEFRKIWEKNGSKYELLNSKKNLKSFFKNKLKKIQYKISY